MFITSAFAAVQDCVPMRWRFANASMLRLLDGTPISCILVDTATSDAAVKAMKDRGLLVFSVVPARTLDGVIEPVSRRELRLDSEAPVIATSQGVWPGIEIEHSGPKTSAPTGGAWIQTNTGFLRFVRAATGSAIWMANAPPDGEWPVARYQQAVSDAATAGARWVIDIDKTFQKRLEQNEDAALKGWRDIMAYVAFYESNGDWRSWKSRSQVAIVQDAASGALITGSLLDMLAVMHTPVRPVHTRELTRVQLDDTKIAVSVNPQAYTDEQRTLLRSFAEKGGKVIQGPAGWTMPLPEGDRIVFDRKQYKQLEAIWPELQLSIMRKNFGARLFNVSGTVSHLLESGGKRLLHLVNYTDYPVESITAVVQGKFNKITLYSPQEKPRRLTSYQAPDGTAVEIDKVGVAAAIVLE